MEGRSFHDWDEWAAKARRVLLWGVVSFCTFWGGVIWIVLR